MFARKVAARLKPNSLQEFTDLMERQIIPWLRTQKGFLDLIILSVPDSTEVATISFWDGQSNAEAYQESGFPEAVGMLAKLLDSTPYVKTFDVVSSTLPVVAPDPSPQAHHPEQTGPARTAYEHTETNA